MADISRYKGGACKKMAKGGSVTGAPKRRAKKMAVGGQVALAPVAMPTPPDVYPGKPGVPYETPRPLVNPKPPVPLETPRPIAGPGGGIAPTRTDFVSPAGSRPQRMKRGGKVKGC